MAFSEYVLLVSLSAGIHAHADTGGIAIGPEAITQPNGGGTRVAAQDSFHKGSTATTQSPTQPSLKIITAPTTVRPAPTNIKPPAVAIPRVK
jgi:hypothetical protein